MQMLLETLLGRPIVLRIQEDNTATIKVLRKGYSWKFCHVARAHKLDLGIVKEAIEDQSVLLDHVETTKQCADIFTKDLPAHAWTHAINLLGLRPLDHGGEAISGPLRDSTSDSKDLLDQESRPLSTTCGGMTACKIIDQIVASVSPAEDSCPLDDQA